MPNLLELMDKDSLFFLDLVPTESFKLHIAFFLIILAKLIFVFLIQEAFSSEINRFLCVLPPKYFGLLT